MVTVRSRHPAVVATLAAVAYVVAVSAVGIVVAPSEARADRKPTSLEEALAAAFDGRVGERYPDLEYLNEAGLEYDGYAVAERLPRSEAFLVEARLRRGDAVLRYPVKVRRFDRGIWSLDWTPRASYAEALVGFVDGEAGVELPDRYVGPWADDERLPALPLIVRKTTIATPFGALPMGDASGVEPPRKLGEHVGRWVDSVLERDRGVAGVDLLVGAHARWRNVTRALFAAASAGLFRVHCVVRRKQGGLGAVPALAPVFERGRTPKPSSSFVVGLDSAYPPRLRVTVAGRLLEPADGTCEAEASLCPEGPEAVADQLPSLVKSSFSGGAPSVSHVMVAVAGGVKFGDALRYAVRVPVGLGIPQKRLYLGHIEAEADGGTGGGQ